MKYQIVLPFIYPPLKDECLASIKLPKENILAVDNTEANIGVAASWNEGVAMMYARECEWLIILSAAVEFGEAGMRDFIDELRKTPKDILACEPSIGWHCIAIRKSVFDRVGTFDENFFPIYFEDNDFGYRCEIDGTILWGSVEGIQITNKIWSHSVKLAGVKSNSNRLLNYLLAKWGGVRDKYVYKTPFNDPNLTIKDWRKGDIDKYCPV